MYKADFKGRAERDLVGLACELTGLSQGAFTRVALLKEARAIIHRANTLAAEEQAKKQNGGEEGGRETDTAGNSGAVPDTGGVGTPTLAQAADNTDKSSPA